MLDYFIEKALQKFFFCGYEVPSETVLEERIRHLEESGGHRVDNCCVESYFLPEKNQKKTTKKIIIYAHTSHCFDLHPKHYDYLRKEGAVVLWNGTKRTPKQYQKDLVEVVKKIQQLHPNAAIVIKGRCATVDPVIGTAKELNNKNIHLILDRGHGNPIQLASLLSCFGNLPVVQRVLQKHFNCHGEEDIASIPGRICFVHTEEKTDEVLYKQGIDLSRQLVAKRGNDPRDRAIVMKERNIKGAHWTPWNRKTREKVLKFIHKIPITN